MAKLSKVDAAKAAGVSRQTLYTYLKDGRLSADAEGLIDTAELLRAGFTLHTGHDSGRQEPGQSGHDVTSSVSPVDVYLDMITLLKQQLTEAQARENAAQERERDSREHIARLTAMLDQAHQQNQRLLDLPRHLPLPDAGLRAPAALAPPRGAIRRRIVALLREHPDGLSPVQTRQMLGVDKDLGSTMKAMVRDGLLRRVDYGRYTVG